MPLCSQFESALAHVVRTPLTLDLVMLVDCDATSGVELLVDCGATSDFMSMQTAKRGRLPLYKRTNTGHVVTAGGVQVEVRYYTRTYVRVGDFVFRHHFKVLEILPEVVLGLPWLRSYNRLSTGRKSMRTYGTGQVHTDCPLTIPDIPPNCGCSSKLDLLSTLSSSTSKASPVGSPTPPAIERPDQHSSTRAKSVADTLDESETEDAITDEQCSDMEIKYIPLPKLKREIRPVDLTGDQVFLCCMPRPAVPVHQMYKMQESSDDDGLDPVRRKFDYSDT